MARACDSSRMKARIVPQYNEIVWRWTVGLKNRRGISGEFVIEQPVQRQYQTDENRQGYPDIE